MPRCGTLEDENRRAWMQTRIRLSRLFSEQHPFVF
jgi:hypothetical protein